MAAKRKTESSTLAFLDIISCGLGAVILIFLIIKHNVDVGSEQIDNLKAQLAAQEETAEQLAAEAEKIRQQNAQIEQAGKTLEDQLVDSEGRLASLRKQNTSKEEQNKIAEGEIKEIEQEVPVDQVEVQGVGQANYIVGMTVEGERIAILIDHSTSMTYPTLEQAVVAKFDSPAQRRRAPKWQRTVRVAKWLMARLPEKSQYAIVGYNNVASMLSPSAGWSSSTSKTDLGQTLQNISRLSPSDGTNLEEGLKMALAMTPRPTNIYIVTDGLPTQGDHPCVKNTTTIPAKCRRFLMSPISKLLQSAYPRGEVPINTILLPMTGDPEAAAFYWGWANRTNGIVFSPTGKWP